jgi:DNA ligase (NAD+)
MVADEIRQRIDELRRLVRHHDRLYYVHADPEISDRDYDLLFAELAELEERHPELRTPDSPTQRVAGEPLPGLQQVTHAVPMLSLDNTYERDELRAWYARLGRQLGAPPDSLVAELKIDGVSISLIYEGGRLARAVTRGDGIVGDDVTANARTIRQLPLVLDGAPALLEVRGEVYMTRRVFADLNRHRQAGGEPLFANPRNATAGAIRLLDPRQAAARRLSLWCYQVARTSDRPPTTHGEGLRLLEGLGFAVSPGWRVCDDLAEVEDFIDHWQEGRRSLDYDTDGVVVKVDRVDEQLRLGATARAVRWAVAYKYPPEGRTTRVEDIVIQVGRSGVLTPVAVLEPVAVAGSTVSRATLHNFDELLRLDVRVGDTVWVSKGGDVIPRVDGVVLAERPPATEPVSCPTSCPECGTAVERTPGEVAIRCPNPSCPAVVASRLRHFVARGAMDIEGLGERSLAQLVDHGLVSDAASLWDLKAEALAALDGWGEVSARRLNEELERARRRPLHRLLFALGIPHVGERAARLLAGRFGRLEALAGASPEELEALDGIGPVIAESVRRWFDDATNAALVERLRARGIDPVEETPEAVPAGPLQGLKMVITGTLSRPRSAVRARLEELGASVSGSVSAKTDLVVAGADPGSKVGRAAELGVRVVDEESLDEMVRSEGGGGLWTQ